MARSKKEVRLGNCGRLSLHLKPPLAADVSAQSCWGLEILFEQKGVKMWGAKSREKERNITLSCSDQVPWRTTHWFASKLLNLKVAWVTPALTSELGLNWNILLFVCRFMICFNPPGAWLSSLNPERKEGIWGKCLSIGNFIKNGKKDKSKWDKRWRIEPQTRMTRMEIWW